MECDTSDKSAGRKCGVGREVQIVGNLVDWDTELNMAVVLVSYHEAPEHPDTDYINR